MKRYIILYIVLLSPFYLYSQVGFTHDESGNRTSRFIIEAADKSTQDDDQSEPDEFVLDTDITILLYPNPTSGLVKMELRRTDSNTPLKVEAKVYTTDGRLILNQTHYSERFEIDITNKANGIYLFDLYVNGNKQVFTIIKE